VLWRGSTNSSSTGTQYAWRALLCFCGRPCYNVCRSSQAPHSGGTHASVCKAEMFFCFCSVVHLRCAQQVTPGDTPRPHLLSVVWRHCPPLSQIGMIPLRSLEVHHRCNFSRCDRAFKTVIVNFWHEDSFGLADLWNNVVYPWRPSQQVGGQNPKVYLFQVASCGIFCRSLAAKAHLTSLL